MRTFRLRLGKPLPQRSFSKSGLVIVGDACHTFNPSVGWGLQLAMLDGLALARCVREASDANRPLPDALAQFDRQQRPLWQAFLEQSELSAYHFGWPRFAVDRMVLSLLPTNLFLQNYDKLSPVVTAGRTLKPRACKYCTVLLTMCLVVCGLIVIAVYFGIKG